MKYKTTIEVICEATDKDNASDIAGDYLKGDVDFGVEMKCKTVSLTTHRIQKYATYSALVLFVVVSVFFGAAPLKNDSTSRNPIQGISTYTVTPALSTKHKDDFKREWENKKDAAVIEYLKK